MIWKKLMPMKGVVPNLVLAQRVIDKMAATASQHIENETGEAMIGVIVPGPEDDGVPTIYVLDTISPDANASEAGVIREAYTFQQGDEGQYEIFTWLIENWETARDKGALQKARWDVPLLHVGDWHKQPGFMIAPSGGDLASALDQLDDEAINTDFLVAPIVTLGHPATTETGSGVNYLTMPMPDSTRMRVDFWYIHRDVGIFQPITPVVYPDEQLPTLAAYPWHLVDQKRAEMEFARFRQHKMFYSILLWDADDAIPLEVCIVVARVGASKVFLLITDCDYPQNPPQIRLAPYITMKEGEDIYDVFAQWWAQSEPAPALPDHQWTEDTHLIDWVLALEAKLGISPPKDEQAPDMLEGTAEDITPNDVG